MQRIPKIIAFIGFMAVFAACKTGTSDKRGSSAAIPVTVTNVTLSKAVLYNPYPGNTVALQCVELRGQVSGYLTGMYFREGQVVKRGQKLYEIDRNKYQAAYDESVSNLRIAEQNLEKVQRDANRYTDLSKQEAVAKQLYENAMTDLQSAKYRVAAANSQMIRAKADYDYSLINAPFDGTIGFSAVKPGGLVSQGQTLLNTISSDDPMGIDIVIEESELGHFQDLLKKAGEKNDTTFRINLPDNSRYPFPGKLSIIDRAVDPQTATIRVRLEVPNPARSLRPGMSCKVQVLDASAGQRLIIPYKAVQEQLGEFFVYKVIENKVKQVKVTLGSKIGTGVIVIDGLQANDMIALDSIQKLNDGSAITIVNSNKQ